MTKHLVLTGASSGIGRELSVLAEKAGFRLSICGRNAQKLASTVEQLDNQADTFNQAFCMTDESAVAAFFNGAVQANGLYEFFVSGTVDGSEQQLPVSAGNRVGSVVLDEHGGIALALSNGTEVGIDDIDGVR